MSVYSIDAPHNTLSEVAYSIKGNFAEVEKDLQKSSRVESYTHTHTQNGRLDDSILGYDD